MNWGNLEGASLNTVNLSYGHLSFNVELPSYGDDTNINDLYQ